MLLVRALRAQGERSPTPKPSKHWICLSQDIAQINLHVLAYYLSETSLRMVLGIVCPRSVPYRNCLEPQPPSQAHSLVGSASGWRKPPGREQEHHGESTDRTGLLMTRYDASLEDNVVFVVSLEAGVLTMWMMGGITNRRQAWTEKQLQRP